MQIVVVKLHTRTHNAVKFQEVLTRYGCDIHVRLGLHEHPGNECSDEGLIILKLQSQSKVAGKMIKELKALGKTEAKLVEF